MRVHDRADAGPDAGYARFGTSGTGIKRRDVQTVEYNLDKFTEGGFNKAMSSKQQRYGGEADGRRARQKPVWADGLRRMYDEVVDEALPDDFLTLLKKLDDASDNS